MNRLKNIIFDLGGVLVDWKPEKLYLEVFEGDQKKVDWFLNEICTFDWNENQDAGYPLAQATEDLIQQFPQYEEWIRMYYTRWEEMLVGPIEGTVAILKQLVKNPEYKIVALTNWSAETFPTALAKYEFLHWFEGIVVSGTEKTRKPFRAIYELTLKRFQIKAAESLFIDDNQRNIEAASELGITTIHFKSPKELVKDLNTLGISL